MLPSPSGSEIDSRTSVFLIEDSTQIGEARRFANSMCLRMGFEETRKGRVGIVINELATNILKYSSRGSICLRSVCHETYFSLEILAIDRGPGIQDTDHALVDGVTTGSSPGTGLGAVRRLSDIFDIYSNIERGSVVLSLIHSKNDPKEKSNFIFSAIAIPFKNETVSGDDYCVRESSERLDVLMVDGLGHGPLAHRAASEAIAEFQNSANEHIEETLAAIHHRLRATRGAAVFMLQFRHGSDEIAYVSAGNIRAIIQSSDSIKTLVSQNGTAGIRLANVKLYHHVWDGRGLLILHTDGLNTRWDPSKYPGILNHHPAVVAAVIYRDHDRGSDDSTILVLKRSP